MKTFEFWLLFLYASGIILSIFLNWGSTRKPWERALVPFRRAHTWTRKQLIYKRARINRNSKCPGCGHFNGRIEMISGLKVIKHTCNVCGAEWGEKPVVAAAVWIGGPSDGAMRITTPGPEPADPTVIH